MLFREWKLWIESEEAKHMVASADMTNTKLQYGFNRQMFGLVALEVSWQRDVGFTEIKPTYEALTPDGK